MTALDTAVAAAAAAAVSRRDSSRRDELVTSHLGLAHRLARRFADRGETHDDLVQVASLVLVRCVERFEPERGIMFSTFAAASIFERPRMPRRRASP